MTKSIEATGASIEAAIQSALDTLQMDRDDVTVEVLEKPRSGFLGIGASPAKIKVLYETSPASKAVDFVQGILTRLGVSAEIKQEVNEEDGLISLELSGPEMGVVIGRRGDTLDAIQCLASLVLNKGEEKHYRLIIDTENYRAKREESLIALAHKVAGKVVKYRRPMTLEPMNPYERRVIHSALQDSTEVTTYSTGSEPNRRVVVVLAGQKGSGSSGSGNRYSGRRGGSRNGGRSGSGKKPAPRTESAADSTAAAE